MKSNKSADEEVESSYGYPSGYKPKSIIEQINRLHELFPDIGYADEQIASQPLPLNAEGWFAIPKWEKIAPTYEEAVQKVLDMIKKTRNGSFYNLCEDQLGQLYLRQSVKTIKAFQVLADLQKSYDILVVPTQFGLRHRGRSIHRARELFTDDEFGLSIFEIGCMLLTHPERLEHHENLWIECAGNEYASALDENFPYTPYFIIYGGNIRLGMILANVPSYFFGSASGFLP